MSSENLLGSLSGKSGRIHKKRLVKSRKWMLIATLGGRKAFMEEEALK